MRLKLIFISTLILFLNFVQAQQFVGMYKEIGTSGGIIQTTTSDFVFGGRIANTWNLSKTDVNGNLLWSKKYGNSSQESFGSFQETSDGGYILAGQTAPNSGGIFDATLIKTDVNGTTQWSKSYGATTGYTQFYAVKEMPSGGYIAVGQTNDYGSNILNSYALRTNALGDTLWTYVYNVPGFSFNTFTDVTIATNGDITMVGQKSSTVGTGALLIKLDQNGNELWNKTYSTGAGLYAGEIELSSDGLNYFVSGRNGSFLSLMKLDTSGNVQFSNSYNFNVGSSTFHSIYVLPNNNGVLMSINDAPGFGVDRSQLLKLDVNGNVIFSKSYSTCTTSSSGDALETQTGGIALLGSDIGMNATALYSLDANGNSGINCLDSNLVVTFNTPTLTITTEGFRTYGAIPTNPMLNDVNYTTETAFYNCQADTADFSWLSYSQCTNDSTQFTSTYTTNSGFSTGFLWDFGDGNTSTLQNPNHLYATAGNYNVQLIVNWGCIADTVTKSITITTGSAPVFGFYTNPADTICNSNVSYIIQSLTADSIFVDFGDATPTITVNNSTFFSNHNYVPGTYNLVSYAYNACGVDTLYDTLTVINPPTSIFSVPSNSFCLSQSTAFNNSSTAGTLPITNWNWEFGDGSTSNLQSPTYAFNNEGTYSVTLTATDAFGCSNSSTQNITLTADNSIASITYSVGCPCTDFSFTSTGTATSWSWDFGDGNTSTTQNPNYSYTMPGQYYVSVVGTNASGCSYKDQIVVDVCPTDTLYTSKSNNNWYFYDKTGVSFNTAVPVANTLGQMASVAGFFAQYTSEGCSTMSNPNTGNLLFYANGNNVWDANHNIMSNGSGINGDVSYSQGTVIVPMPGNQDKYYIFTSRETGDTSVYYSIVDMTLNGGLGDVEAANKNVFLTSFNGSEAMSATIKSNPQCDGSPAEYWLIIPKDNVVYEVYLISSAGVTLNSTATFPVPSTFLFGSNNNIWGNSTFSPNGSKYVKSIINQGFFTYDFNTTTGILSNQVYYIDSSPSNYDYEFSPNGQYLYSAGGNGIRRYDFLASDVLGSMTVLSNNSTGTMWKGDDGNIYTPRNGSTFLSRINNTNSNTSTVTNNAVSLLGRTTYLGLQNIVKLNIPIQDTSLANFTSTPNCLDVVFQNTSDTTNYTDPCSFLANNDTLNYAWDFGDGTTSTQWSPTHSYLVNGMYQVRLIVNRPFMCTSDTTYQNVEVTSCCTSTSQFVKTYGEGEANWVEQTTDCGFIMAGYRTISGNDESCLIRTDANGDLLWSNLYNGAYFADVKETPDGGFIAIGNSIASVGAGQGDMYLVKTDANGTVQWSKTYGGSEWEWGSHVQPLTDGGYILVGQSFSYEQVTTPTTFFDAYLVRTNAVGDTLWTTTYHANNSSFGNGAFGVKLNANGNFIVAGVTQTTNHQSWLAEFDYDTGNIIWSKDYDRGSFSESYIPQQLPNGNYAFSGFTQNSVLGNTDAILKITDDTGNLISATVYGGAGGDTGRDMELTSDGGYVIVGETNSYGYGGQELILFKLDNNGNSQWTKTYGGCENENRPSVTQTTDGGYAIVAKTNSLGSFGTTNIILIKTDANGNSGLTCFETNPTVGSQSVTLTENNGAIQTRAGIVTNINQPATIALVDTLTPQCVFTADFVADSVCVTSTTTFIDSSSTDIAPCSWLWDFNDLASGANNTSTLQNPTHTFSSAGTFNVTLTTTWMGVSESVTLPVIVYPDYNPTVDTSICIGSDYTYPDGTTSTNIVVNESNISNLTTINGCDSIITTNLTVLPLSFNTINTAMCQGDSILLQGGYQSTVGTYVDTLFGASSVGCDSIVTTNLIVNPIPIGTSTASVCQGDSVLIGNIYYSTAGTYNDTIFGGAFTGCDSIVQVTLTILPVATGTDTQTACVNYTWIDGITYTSNSTTATDTIFGGATNGCDSIVTLDLTILQPALSTDTQTACENFVWIDGNIYTSNNNTATDTIFGGAINGCDSIITLNLTIFNTTSSTTNINICQGDSILINGNFESISGTYADTLFGANSNGCDSIVNTILTVTPMANASINPVSNLCLNDTPTTLTAANSGGTWSGNGITDATNGIFSPSTNGVGTQQIIYTISGTCGDADTIDVTVNANPSITYVITDDNCGAAEGLIEVTVNTGINPITFNWDTGENTQNITNLTEGIYTVIVTDSSGCSITEPITLNDQNNDCEFHIYLPNAFTPNGDGENDVLFLRGKGIESFTLVIYNRWGNKVFETNSLTYGWDGTFKGNVLNPAVFVYVVDVTFVNGETTTEKGNISIIK